MVAGAFSTAQSCGRLFFYNTDVLITVFILSGRHVDDVHFDVWLSRDYIPRVDRGGRQDLDVIDGGLVYKFVDIQLCTMLFVLQYWRLMTMEKSKIFDMFF